MPGPLPHAFVRIYTHESDLKCSPLNIANFSLLVRCKICKKPVRRYDVGAPSGITISIPGADSQDAERRRQIALRALSGGK